MMRVLCIIAISMSMGAACGGPLIVRQTTPNEPLSRHGNPPYYNIGGIRYIPLRTSRGYQATGQASWYGTAFHGLKTANGERFDKAGLTAAHKTLPLPTYVEVTNLSNQRKIVVRVNDRGPFHGDRLIDLSYAAAQQLKFAAQGLTQVSIRALPSRRPHKTPRTFVQIGAYRNRSTAESLKRRLIDTQLYSQTKIMTGSSAWFRVQIGPFQGLQEVNAALLELKRQGMREWFFVSSR